MSLNSIIGYSGTVNFALSVKKSSHWNEKLCKCNRLVGIQTTINSYEIVREMNILL